MANVTFGATAGTGHTFIDFLRTPLSTVLDYDNTSHSSTALTMSDDVNNYMKVEGTDLEYVLVNGVVFGIRSGTITAIKFVSAGNTILEINNATIDAAQAGQAIDSNSSANFLSVLLGGDDTVTGSSADDYLIAGGGNNTIDGGAGFDRLILTGQASDYTVSRQGDAYSITSKSGTVDLVRNVERIVFSSDSSVSGDVIALDTAGNAGQAYRLYQAAFDRTPDKEGLAYWTGRLDSGNTNLKAVADSFLESPEFASTYGTPQTVSNAKYIELLYTHTLGRTYDQSGFDYWVGRLDAGATNRADLLAFFSESDENQARVSDAISDGIWLV